MTSSVAHHQAVLQAIDFFNGLPESSVLAAISHAVIRQHPADEGIILESDWGGAVYFILQGWVKIGTHNLDGKEVTLNILGSGELFGEMAALEDIPRSSNVRTLVTTTIGSIPAQDFVKLLQTEPLAGLHLAKLLSRRLRQLNRRLQLRESDSTTRVVDILLFLVEGQGQQMQHGIAIPNLPQRELSSLSGLARETVTRVLSKLEKKNLIVRDRDILQIPDIIALEKLLT
jgi:CRP/FNR family transcriptional regulator, cyclic AMP receptor protein